MIIYTISKTYWPFESFWGIHNFEDFDQTSRNQYLLAIHNHYFNEFEAVFGKHFGQALEAGQRSKQQIEFGLSPSSRALFSLNPWTDAVFYVEILIFMLLISLWTPIFFIRRPQGAHSSVFSEWTLRNLQS